MQMKIIKAQKHQLIEVLYIIGQCSRELQKKGVRCWNNSINDYNDIATDISKNHVFIATKNLVPVATITIKPDESKDRTLIISRLAVFPAYQRKGIANQLLQFAITLGSDEKFEQVTGQIPLEDQSTINLLKKNGFESKTPAQPNSDDLRIVFERNL